MHPSWDDCFASACREADRLSTTVLIFLSRPSLLWCHCPGSWPRPRFASEPTHSVGPAFRTWNGSHLVTSRSVKSLSTTAQLAAMPEGHP